MDGNKPSADNAFLLGEIKATVTGTAEDVKAIRNDVGSLSTRVSDVEKAQEKTDAERAIMVPDYKRFVHKVNNYMGVNDAKWARAEGTFKGAEKGASVMTKIAHAVLIIVIMIVGVWLGGHGVHLPS